MAETTGSPEYMARTYVEYQRKYRQRIRESDKILIELIGNNVPHRLGKSLLDIGCHSGNLLYHIKNILPGFLLTGGDLFPEVVARCASDPDLVGVEFKVMDLRDLQCEPMDVIVASAVLFRFCDEEHRNIWHRLYRILKPGGMVLSYDLYNPFRQLLRIIEETETHPEGLVLNFRSQHDVDAELRSIGFRDIEFHPFQIAIDLDLRDPTDPLYTHTRRLADGERLQFRGALYQPWCHLVARKG